jgi:hypothetical protein
MKTKEEIEQFAEQDFNDRQECGHYELADLKSRDYYYDGFTNGYNQCQQDMADVDNVKVTRFEVIDENGRVYVKNSLYNCHLELSYQDDGRTLKVFIKSNKQD